MNRNRAKEVESGMRLRPLHSHLLFLLRSMVFVLFGTAFVAHSQSVPPPDPQLNAAGAQMSAFEKTLQTDRSDAAARKNELNAAIRYSLAEKREHREQAALWLLLRARYWVPDVPDLLTDLGVQEDYLKLFVDADKTLAEALRIRPNDRNTLYTVARVKMDLGQMQAAEQAWHSYIKQDPRNPSAYYGYGIVLQTLGRDDEARSQFKLSIKVNPDQAES